MNPEPADSPDKNILPRSFALKVITVFNITAWVLWIGLRSVPLAFWALKRMSPRKRRGFVGEFTFVTLGGILCGALFVRSYFALSGESATLWDIVVQLASVYLLAKAMERLHRRWGLHRVAVGITLWSVPLGVTLGLTTT